MSVPTLWSVAVQDTRAEAIYQLWVERGAIAIEAIAVTLIVGRSCWTSRAAGHGSDDCRTRTGPANELR